MNGFIGVGIGPLAIGRSGAPVASWTVTTTGAATHTIAALTVSASTVVDWGDGSTSTYTGSGARTHNYAGAGTWTVRVMQPLNVTTLTLSDNKVTLNSADIATMSNMATFSASSLKAGNFDSSDVSSWRPTSFYLYSMPSGYAGTFDSADVSSWRPTNFSLTSMPSGYAGTFDSADVSSWRPTAFELYLMPSGYAGTFDSADVSSWRPTSFLLYAMPSGYAGTFDSADVSSWRPTTFYLQSMPSGYAGTFDSADVSSWRPTAFYLFSMPSGYVFTIAAGNFAAWTTTSNFRMQSNALTQTQVDAILWGLHQASTAPRTATGGTINVGGTNAAPSGTYQAATSCPVTVATPGKEIAHELLNDTCGAFANHWATVTITA